MIYDIVVIGGGAAGMMAAVNAVKNNKRICIIEHNDKLGKKILQTGNGRCNLTNFHINKECYGMENANIAFDIISKFDNNAVINFFEEIGVLIHDRNGYVYPKCDQASVVSEYLAETVSLKGIDVKLSTNVEKIQKEDIFTILTNNGKVKSKKVIIAAGSKAYPKSGSDGSGYRFAENMGHKIIKPLPALTSLKSNAKFCKSISGVRADGLVSLYINDQLFISERGEIQFTDYGISGIPVFQISRYAVKALDKGKKVNCHIDLMPDYTDEKLKELLFKKQEKYNDIYWICGGLVNKKITDMIIKYFSNNINKFVFVLKNLQMDIFDYNGFDYGQVCQGGVDLSEINVNTMESKLVKDLYFAGEILDVDGICGGYNLQWAWSSGYLAGKAAGND